VTADPHARVPPRDGGTRAALTASSGDSHGHRDYREALQRTLSSADPGSARESPVRPSWASGRHAP
jgi:hypothetical protein